ncbi:NAD(P)-binding domain-containing protein [Shouchella miscanthi]|uniref:NAD(P)-binding domain-containing protein n=1 Tax=Shouchella miscanthi TaxID=2598861 RepID=A0ABU6NHQ4_9BACI|nr:NAD(P)-binding domain-containing protein [Shouchella miscanthi]MED4126938.1 NAD(P)-binding domain-containing protein [Shouchella miscanthi]
MEKQRVAIIGTGRMGKAIATQIHSYFQLTLLNRGSKQGKELAAYLKVAYSTDFRCLNTMNLILCCVPQDATTSVLNRIAHYASPNTIIMNCSTKAWVDKELKQAYSKLHFVEAKIIGHATSIEAGKQAAIFADATSKGVQEDISSLFSPFATVVFEHPAVVEKLNQVATEIGIQAAVTVEQKVEGENLSPFIKEVLIDNVCAGVMSAYVHNDLGHFAKQIVADLQGRKDTNERNL